MVDLTGLYVPEYIYRDSLDICNDLIPQDVQANIEEAAACAYEARSAGRQGAFALYRRAATLRENGYA